jgi:hypothetical protein
MQHGVVRTRRFRVIAGVVAVAVVGTATVALAARQGEPAPLGAFVPIEQVRPNVVAPKVRRGGSSGVFTVDCGTNGNRKLSPDNPVAQPGVKNGAQHVHDFVGNLSISADSTDESLEDSETTCKSGDKSSYFWPVVRINPKANAYSSGNSKEAVKRAGRPEVVCPSVRDRLPAVPQRARDEVDRNLALLDQQVKEADDRVARDENPGDPDFVNNAILGPLRDKRVATLDRIAISIGRAGARPNLMSLIECDLSFDKGAHGNHGSPAEQGNSVGETATPTADCPSVRDKLPAVPQQAVDEVNRNLALLDKQVAEANQRLATSKGQGGPNFVDNAILGPLKDKRVATIDRMAIAIGRNAPKPQGLDRLAPCALDNAGNNGGGNNDQPLPGANGRNLELAGNVGRIVQPAQVRIEYRGNAAAKVTGMPKFLKMITGDAKPTSRGPANARATWTCGGFEDRLSDKYVICPQGSPVMRVHDFPGCWDGRNTDSANHRDHVRFADRNSGACPSGFTAIPQLRISVVYDIPQDVQRKGQYQLDSFPEENHNPFSDHNDFANVNPDRTMAQIVQCVNEGRRCG